jgi:RNA recognition motif-containing protein
MNTKLYIGNLTFDATQQDLEDLFSQAGTVKETIIISDRTSGRSRGFGFVVMSDDAGAQKAISQFNNHDFQGRNLTVNVAKEREAYASSAPRGGGGGGGSRRF